MKLTLTIASFNLKPLLIAHLCCAAMILSPIRAQQTDPSLLLPDTCGLVNADALRRDQAFLQMELFRNTLATLEKTDIRYEIARKRFKSAKQLYWFYSELAKTTEETIRAFQLQNPGLYAHIQSLRSDCGKPVVAMVGTYERFSPIENLGETWVNYDTSMIKGEPIPMMEEEWVNGIRVLPRMYYAVQIQISTSSDITALRHELGHYEVIVSHSKAYYAYLQHLNQLGKSTNGGHNPDDASGMLATKYERLQR